VKKSPVYVVLDHPAVNGIGGAAREEKRIKVITEARPAHSA